MVKSTAPQHSTKAKAALNNPNLVEVQPKVHKPTYAWNVQGVNID